MDSKDTNFNNEQKVNEGFSGENVSQHYDPSGKPLKAETERDRHGNTDTVMRHRELNENPEKSSGSVPDPHHETTAREMKKNEDFNRDIAPDRYSSSHPENHIDRAEP